jgi:SpoVK/Ycf46/Vps4 family AAA+-type ATPase
VDDDALSLVAMTDPIATTMPTFWKKNGRSTPSTGPFAKAPPSFWTRSVLIRHVTLARHSGADLAFRNAMSHPLLRLLAGTSGRNAVQAVVPRRTFDDVILPPKTRRALHQALVQVTSHDLVFRRWGLGERHPTGLALAFHFAGPPGTGKTICADAIAHALGRPLLIVRYAEIESMWLGETPKQIAAVFRRARETRSVLFFDEADAIASRRSSAPDLGSLRETNTAVNVLLQELEAFTGVVIFATNMAANLDPAFERRVRTHVLFEMPRVIEREQIWRVQMHPELTPLGGDVDFRLLAEKYEASGGDIRNAVLKAALVAASEPGRPEGRAISQRHLEDAMRDVLESKQVMRQTVAARGGPAGIEASLAPLLVDRRLFAMLALAAVLNAGALVTALVILLIAIL